MNWDELSNYHFYYKKTPDYFFTRTKSIQQKYEQYLKENNNIYDDIINNYFKYNDLFVLKENRFPYNITSNIKHYILWFNPKIYKFNKLHILLNPNYITIILNRYIKNKYICFMNVPEKQSIKNIYHYHVFIKE